MGHAFSDQLFQESRTWSTVHGYNAWQWTLLEGGATHWRLLGMGQGRKMYLYGGLIFRGGLTSLPKVGGSGAFSLRKIWSFERSVITSGVF